MFILQYFIIALFNSFVFSTPVIWKFIWRIQKLSFLEQYKSFSIGFVYKIFFLYLCINLKFNIILYNFKNFFFIFMFVIRWLVFTQDNVDSV